MATLFEAYVTNAGKYSEGQLVGETLKFPTTAQEVEALLKRIGVDGVRYQEIFITSFDGDVLGLYDHLSEYENLDELNHLACLLSELTSSELETLEAVLDSGEIWTVTAFTPAYPMRKRWDVFMWTIWKCWMCRIR